MNALSYPLRYLQLRSEVGTRLYARDKRFVFIGAALTTLPFVFGESNFFGTSGLLERMGSFTSVLTGFYIAALVGVASLSPSVGDLDSLIEDGPILRPVQDEHDEAKLTRRQYVCSLFGYLAFVALFLCIFSIVIVSLSPLLAKFFVVSETYNIVEYRPTWEWFSDTMAVTSRAIAVFIICVVFFHIVSTTFHGLYYYIDRIYDRKSEINQKC